MLLLLWANHLIFLGLIIILKSEGWAGTSQSSVQIFHCMYSSDECVWGQVGKAEDQGFEGEDQGQKDKPFSWVFTKTRVEEKNLECI